MGLFGIGGDSKTTVATTNQQVGLQGTNLVGQTGTIGGSQAANGATAIGDIGRGSYGATVNIVSADQDAIRAIENFGTASVNGAQIIAINALSALQEVTERGLSASAHATDVAQQIAAGAVPVDPGAYALAAGATQTDLIKKVALFAVVGVVAFFAFRKNR